MFHIHYDDPVFQHGITNSLVTSMTMEAIFQDKKEELFQERESGDNLRAFKIAVEALQNSWYGGRITPPGQVPAMYIEDLSSNVGPQLKEVLSFPTRGSMRLSDDLWQSYLLTQPMWSVISGLAEAYNNVRRERGESVFLIEAWAYVNFLLRWFQGFVRTRDVVHQAARLLE